MTIAMQHLQFSDPISSPVYCAILASNDPRDDRLDQQSSEIMRRFRAQNLGGFPSLKTFHQESDPQDSRPPGSMVCCTEEIGTGRFLQLQSNCHFCLHGWWVYPHSTLISWSHPETKLRNHQKNSCHKSLHDCYSLFQEEALDTSMFLNFHPTGYLFNWPQAASSRRSWSCGVFTSSSA